MALVQQPRSRNIWNKRRVKCRYCGHDVKGWRKLNGKFYLIGLDDEKHKCDKMTRSRGALASGLRDRSHPEGCIYAHESQDWQSGPTVTDSMGCIYTVNQIIVPMKSITRLHKDVTLQKGFVISTPDGLFVILNASKHRTPDGWVWKIQGIDWFYHTPQTQMVNWSVMDSPDLHVGFGNPSDSFVEVVRTETIMLRDAMIDNTIATMQDVPEDSFPDIPF